MLLGGLPPKTLWSADPAIASSMKLPRVVSLDLIRMRPVGSKSVGLYFDTSTTHQQVRILPGLWMGLPRDENGKPAARVLDTGMRAIQPHKALCHAKLPCPSSGQHHEDVVSFFGGLAQETSAIGALLKVWLAPCHSLCKMRDPAAWPEQIAFPVGKPHPGGG
jgi:hypothetical protein